MVDSSDVFVSLFFVILDLVTLLVASLFSYRFVFVWRTKKADVISLPINAQQDDVLSIKQSLRCYEVSGLDFLLTSRLCFICFKTIVLFSLCFCTNACFFHDDNNICRLIL